LNLDRSEALVAEDSKPGENAKSSPPKQRRKRKPRLTFIPKQRGQATKKARYDSWNALADQISLVGKNIRRAKMTKSDGERSSADQEEHLITVTAKSFQMAPKNIGIETPTADKIVEKLPTAAASEPESSDSIGFAFGCEFCPEIFFSEELLKMHTRKSHDNLKPFLCNYCQKRFESDSLLKTHLFLHSGQTKKYECVDCGMSCKNMNSFNAHSLVHQI
jgi:hypothetical protein